jgi:antitoxin YobK
VAHQVKLGRHQENLMSFQDMWKAFDLIEKNSHMADFEGAKSGGLISRAESVLGVGFPATYKAFLSRYGCGDIAGREFYGIIGEDFEDAGIPDAVWITLQERKDSDLPRSLVIICAVGDGTYFALDCATRNEADECPVVAWTPGVAEKQAVEPVSEDFGNFLRQTIENALV